MNQLKLEVTVDTFIFAELHLGQKYRTPYSRYQALIPKISRILGVVNAFGFVALAFRGHNLILEIQASMPSSEKNPSQVPMWKIVKSAYLLIAMCLFPLAIGGYWAYGNMIPKQGGM